MFQINLSLKDSNKKTETKKTHKDEVDESTTSDNECIDNEVGYGNGTCMVLDYYKNLAHLHGYRITKSLANTHCCFLSISI